MSRRSTHPPPFNGNSHEAIASFSAKIINHQRSEGLKRLGAAQDPELRADSGFQDIDQAAGIIGKVPIQIVTY